MNYVSSKQQAPQHTVYQDVKVGNNIRVIKYDNSPLNIYKGYVGEIKAYKSGQNYAMIFLHAIQTYNLIKMPLEHFIILK